MLGALSNQSVALVIGAALVAFLALVALARSLLARSPSWRRLRVGVFVERDPELVELEPPAWPGGDDVTRELPPRRERQ